MRSWDYNKNNIDISQVGYCSNVKYYWICKNNHSYTQSPDNITLQNCSCPYCNNRKLLSGFNDLQTKYPEIAREWDTNKNSLQPSQVFPNSKIKAWWICEKNHSYFASISSRVHAKTACPYCSHQKPILGQNDLQTLYPHLVNEWDYNKNTTLPTSYLSKSNKKVWWKCSKGHSYTARICDKLRGDGCPYCANKLIIIGENDLFTTNPELEQSWDYTKNSVNPKHTTRGSNKKVWWICPKGHSWQATISSRAKVRGNNCPYCAKELQTSLQENIIAFYLKKLFKVQTNVKLSNMKKMEFDIFLPEHNIAIEYDGSNWLKNVEKDLNKDYLCELNNIVLIRIREPNCPIYKSASIMIITTKPYSSMLYLKQPLIELLKILGKLTNSNTNIEIDIEKDYIEILKEREISEKFNSCLNLPFINEWNYEKNGNLQPSAFKVNSNRKVWWICKHGHEWQAIIESRTKGNGCPFCNGKKAIRGVNDLSTVNPKLASEWNYSKNKISPLNIRPNSNKKVWWICSKGHEWEAVISSRNAGSNCPYCSNQKVLVGYNDLATTHPNIAKEWNFEKNNPLLPTMFTKGSDKKVWWKCELGHEWQAHIYTRTSKKPSKCPKCQREKNNKN